MLCTIQCCLNGVHIGEVPKSVADSTSVTTYAMQLSDPLNAVHMLIIPLQLSRVTSYFDVYFPSIAEYENENIPEIHLTAKEPPWDSSTSEYSERETRMLDY